MSKEIYQVLMTHSPYVSDRESHFIFADSIESAKYFTNKYVKRKEYEHLQTIELFTEHGTAYNGILNKSLASIYCPIVDKHVHFPNFALVRSSLEGETWTLSRSNRYEVVRFIFRKISVLSKPTKEAIE